jgi:hypothetical protein
MAVQLHGTAKTFLHSVQNKNEYQKQKNNVSGEQNAAGA